MLSPAHCVVSALLPDNLHPARRPRSPVRVRLLQAFAIVAALHAVTPMVDPAVVGLGELERHYGETVQLQGRVAEIDPAGEVLRVALVDGDTEASVLTRGPPPELGARVTVRGQPSPGEHGPVVWSEGPIETLAAPAGRDHVPVGQALREAPRLAGAPLAVVGTWPDNGSALLGDEGRLPVDPAGVTPEPGRVLVWGVLAYQQGQARYALEATGWRPWTLPSR